MYSFIRDCLFCLLPIRLCCSFWLCVRSRNGNDWWRSFTGFPWVTSRETTVKTSTTYKHTHHYRSDSSPKNDNTVIICSKLIWFGLDFWVNWTVAVLHISSNMCLWFSLKCVYVSVFQMWFMETRWIRAVCGACSRLKPLYRKHMVLILDLSPRGVLG